MLDYKLESPAWAMAFVFALCASEMAVASSSQKTKLSKVSPSSVVNASNTESTLRIPLSDDVAVRRQIFGQMRFESMQYMRDIPESPDLTNSKFLSARISALGSLESANWLSYAGDASAGTFFRSDQTEFIVHEVSMTARLSKSVSLSVGRKKADWSELDKRWKLGMWQPKFAMDSLRPESQGLSGVFFDWTGDRFQLAGYASPIFIPTTGPDMKAEDGDLKSGSRWLRQPSSEYAFNNRVNSIEYRIDMPETWKLVGNPGSGFMGRIGSKERGPWAAVGTALKPVNEIILKRQNFKAAAADRVDVTIAPDVTYHELASADLGYSFENVSVSASYLEDRPRAKAPEADSAIQKLEGIRASSLQIDWNIKDLFSRSFLVQAGVLRVDGGSIVDVDSLGNPDEITLFDSRVLFKDAYTFGVQGLLGRPMNKPLLAKFSYLYDRWQKGSLMSTELQLQPLRQWALIVGFDFLGVDDETYRPSGFLNQYRANDRVYGGMTYVF